MCVQSGQCISFREMKGAQALHVVTQGVGLVLADLTCRVRSLCVVNILGADTSNQLKVFAQLAFSFVLGILSVR